MTYRELATPHVPRRSFWCVFRLCRLHADAHTWTYRCYRCGRNRLPRTANEVLELHHHSHLAQTAKAYDYLSALLAWQAGGSKGRPPPEPPPSGVP